jgi:two-component system response regulator
VVLLVEDDPDHFELVSRALAAHDDPVRLVHVPNGAAALCYLAREGAWTDPEASPRPDLVLLDLRLPGMSGGEVLRQIKAAPALRAIPVVILSTSEARGDLSSTEGEQADACAVKPIDGESFRELVQELVTSWTAAGSAGR